MICNLDRVVVVAVVAVLNAVWADPVLPGDPAPPAFCRGNDCPKFTVLATTEVTNVRLGNYPLVLGATSTGVH